MAVNSLNFIKDFNNAQLIEFIEKNGPKGITESVSEKGIDGECFLELTEFDIIQWKLPPQLRKQLWSFLIKLRKNPKLFIKERTAPRQSLQVGTRLGSSEKTEIKPKLEVIINLPKVNVVKKPVIPQRPENSPIQQRPKNILIQQRPENISVSPRPDNVSTPQRPENSSIQQRPENSSIQQRPENISVSPRPDNVSIPQRPENSSIQQRPENISVSPRPDNVSTPQPPENSSIQQRPENMSRPQIPSQCYLQMDVGKNSVKNSSDNDVYEANGYLIPVQQQNVEGENDYEPSPTEKTVTHFQTNPVKTYRKPLVTRQESPDYLDLNQQNKKDNNEETYETPDQIETKSKNNFILTPRTANRTPSPRRVEDLPQTDDAPALPPRKLSSVNENKPVNPIKDENSENNTGTLSKFFGFLSIRRSKRNMKNPPTPQSNQIENPHPSYGNAPKPYNNQNNQKINNRPLPALPVEVNNPTENSYELGPRSLTPEIQISEDKDDNEPGRKYSLKSEVESSIPTDFLPSNPNSYDQFVVDKANLPAPPRSLPLPPQQLLQQFQNAAEEPEDYDSVIFNLNDEPFYRHTDRAGAKLLLQGLEDGAFLFRPSKGFLTLTVKYKLKFFHLKMEKTPSNLIKITSHADNRSLEFETLNRFVEYFTDQALTLLHQDTPVNVYLKKVLPANVY